MARIHSIPEIYNPDIPDTVKCKMIEQLCRVLAEYRGLTITDLRNDLRNKLHVDFTKLENNPIGMLIL